MIYNLHLEYIVQVLTMRIASNVKKQASFLTWEYCTIIIQFITLTRHINPICPLNSATYKVWLIKKGQEIAKCVCIKCFSMPKSLEKAVFENSTVVTV